MHAGTHNRAHGAVKHILSYVVGTLHWRVRYSRGPNIAPLIGSNDNDLGGDVDNWRDTAGIIFFIRSNLVSWQSRKQRVVALSSSESRYMSASCQGIWLTHLLGEIHNEEPHAIVINIDNKSSISLNKNPVCHDRIKHTLRFGITSFGSAYRTGKSRSSSSDLENNSPTCSPRHLGVSSFRSSEPRSGWWRSTRRTRFRE